MKQRAVYVKPKTEILGLDEKDVVTDIVTYSLERNGDHQQGDGKDDFVW